MDIGVFKCFRRYFDPMALLLLEENDIPERWSLPQHVLDIWNRTQPEKGWGISQHLEQIRKLFRENTIGTILSGIESLLQDRNWRLHLLAAVATMFLDEESSTKICDKLWQVIHEDSLVSPQLLVVLSKKDHRFLLRGKRILYSDLPIVKVQGIGIPENIYNEKKDLPDDLRKKELKEDYEVRSALKYLILGTVDQSSEGYGGRKAKEWNEKLEELVKKKAFSL